MDCVGPSLNSLSIFAWSDAAVMSTLSAPSSPAVVPSLALVVVIGRGGLVIGGMDEMDACTSG